MPVVRSRELESGTSTTLPAPLKDNALPNRPATRAAPVIVAPLPLPDESIAAAPDAASHPYAATRLAASIRRLSSVSAQCHLMRPPRPRLPQRTPVSLPNM